MRKVIQLIKDPSTKSGIGLYALCADGTIWFCRGTVTGCLCAWQRVPEPPDDEPANLVRPAPGQPTVEEVNRAAWERRMKARAEREAAEREHS